MTDKRDASGGTENGAADDRALLSWILRCADIGTNAERMADTLLSCFGNYPRVMCSSYEQLMRVQGMTEAAALLICLIRNVYRKKFPSASMLKKGKTAAMSTFIGGLISHSFEEQLWAAGYDEFGRLVKCSCIQHGDACSVQSSIGSLLVFSSLYNAKVISLAHNHPDALHAQRTDDALENEADGDVMSCADTAVFALLEQCLGMFDIRLDEYLIVTDRMHVFRFNEGKSPKGGERHGQQPLESLAYSISSETDGESVKNH